MEENHKRQQLQNQNERGCILVFDGDGNHHNDARCDIQLDFEILDDAAIEEKIAAERDKKQKIWKERPTIWEDMTEYWIDANRSMYMLRKAYPKELSGKDDVQATKLLARWLKDKQDNKQVGKNIGGIPVIGLDLDNELANIVRARIAVGLQMDLFMMRLMVRKLIRRDGKEHLLVENGGKNVFGDDWCFRFYKRHKFKRRVATTKMRLAVPADYDQKLEKYLEVGAQIFSQNDIPPDLVVNGDETSVNLVGKSKFTFAQQGARKVRAIGIGDNDKAAVTATLCISATGDVLPAQIIWPGKTNRTHPRGNPPEGVFWDHTESHWQTPDSFKRFIDKVLVPWKKRKIEDLGLDPDQQKMVFKLDMHYSHHKEEMAKYMLERNIIPLYVPAGCTDILQECDVCLNFVFKVEIRNQFRDYLHNQFMDWCAENEGVCIAEFRPSMATSVLKGKLSDWLRRAIECLHTPEMRLTIIKCFDVNGKFDEIRKRAAIRRESVVQTELDVAAMLAAFAQMIGGNLTEEQQDNLEEDKEYDPVDDLTECLEVDEDADAGVEGS